MKTPSFSWTSTFSSHPTELPCGSGNAVSRMPGCLFRLPPSTEGKPNGGVQSFESQLQLLLSVLLEVTSDPLQKRGKGEAPPHSYRQLAPGVAVSCGLLPGAWASLAPAWHCSHAVGGSRGMRGWKGPFCCSIWPDPLGSRPHLDLRVHLLSPPSLGNATSEPGSSRGFC